MTERVPTKTFHRARLRAFGLYLDITMPELRMPIAEKTNATVPVVKEAVDAVCLY